MISEETAAATTTPVSMRRLGHRYSPFPKLLSHAVGPAATVDVINCNYYCSTVLATALVLQHLVFLFTIPDH